MLVAALAGAAVGVLTDLAVDEATLQRVKKLLADYAADLGELSFPPTSGSVFGSADAAPLLSQHTRTAERKVAEDILKMTEALLTMRDGFDKFELGAFDADQDAAASFARLQRTPAGSGIYAPVVKDPGRDAGSDA